MPFPVSCNCGQRFMAQDYLEGQQVPCPSCGQPMLIQRPRPVSSPRTSATKILACQCGKRFKMRADLAGQQMSCPACGAPLRSASPSQAPAPSSSYDPLAGLESHLSQPMPQPVSRLPNAYSAGTTAAEDAHHQQVVRILVGVLGGGRLDRISCRSLLGVGSS